MIITKHGPGSVRVQTSGTAIVIDPTDNRLKADVTLHTETSLPLPKNEITESTELVGPGEYDISGVKIKGFLVEGGGPDTLKTVYEVNAEGMSLVFLGNPKQTLSIGLREKLGNVDIVFAPPGSASFIKQIEAPVVVGLHMKNAAEAKKELSADIESVEKVTIKAKDIPTKPVYYFIHA